MIKAMNTNIHLINGYIQTIYLYQRNDELLLFDSGCRCDAPLIEKFIEEKLNLKLENLKLIVVTHFHPDHAGTAMYFKKNYGIPLAGPDNFNSWYAGVEGILTYIVDIFLTYLVAYKQGRGLKNVLFPRKVLLSNELFAGDKLPQFPEWEVLEASGHTNTDISLKNESLNVIYIADNIVAKKDKLFRPYPLFNPNKYKESLNSYLSLEGYDFLLAHGGRISIAKQQIETLIASTPRTPRRHKNSLIKILAAIFIKSIKAKDK